MRFLLHSHCPSRDQTSLSLAEQAVVRPGRLPEGIEAGEVPGQVRQSREALTNPDGERPLDNEAATLEVASKLCTDFGYALKVGKDPVAFPACLSFICCLLKSTVFRQMQRPLQTCV